MNTYAKFHSKVKRIIIPLPGFKFSHHTYHSKDRDSRFVGRNNIEALLKNWLDVSPNSSRADFTGSYLITGYRGMGKTSFVNKVIDDLNSKRKCEVWKYGGTKPYRKAKFALLCLLPTLLCLMSVVLAWFYSSKAAWYLMGFTVFSSISIIYWLLFKKAPRLRKESRTILKIKVNIGNEISNVRDVLSLLSYSIRDRLQEHIEHKYILSPTGIATRLCKSLFIGIAVFLIALFSIDILSLGSVRYFTASQDSFVYHIIEYINNVGLGLKNGSYRVISLVLGVFISYGVAYLLWLMFKKLVNAISFSWKNLIYAHPAYFLNRINDLCYRIDSSVSEDNSPYGDFNVSSYFSIIWRRKKTRQYVSATVREIEHELIELIRLINASKLLQCRFIVILDELDKLCIPSNDSDGNHLNRDSDNLPEFSNDDNGMSDEMSANEKRHRILAFLSQLKYFVSTAEAKFIFIAGHELYDAYKADVSDREFSISSIFNGVINVNSFFSYDSRIKDVTRMTETYLCRILFGPESQQDFKQKSNEKIAEHKKYRLSEYLGKISIDDDEGNKKKQAVVCFLKRFVTYLTFVSNGAPKKLNARLERYIISSDKFDNDHKNTDDYIFVKLINQEKQEPVQFYLSFGYHDQQKVGFVHYFASPIFENIISPASDYGDKFLVSSSFLIAHLYKHHKSGFSWRNLEYLPDLIDNNRTPELREFVSSVIDYLGKIHLTNITSGIFAYKFPMKLAEEIAIFTKKSDELSAIFNFSLDYFSSVKKYYYRLIDFYTKQKGNVFMASAIHHNLGDIHMANDEYSEAIIQYRYALSTIEKEMAHLSALPDDSGNLASCIVRYIRLMMKLGNAYEKRNTIDSAHLIYTSVCSRLISYREIDESLLGLSYYYMNTKESCRGKSDSVILTNEDNRSFSYYEDVFRKECYPEVITPDDTLGWKFWIQGKEIVNNLSEYLTPRKHSVITKLSVFEDLRMAYLPVLSKLWALEKYNICGITDDNLKLAEAEFRYMYIITNSKDKNLLRIDFYRKLGDILYYKNKSGKKAISDSLLNMMNCWSYDFKSIVFNYCYRKGMPKGQISLYLDCFNAYDLWNEDCVSQDRAAKRLSELYVSKCKNEIYGVAVHCEDEAKKHFAGMFNDMPYDFNKDFPKLSKCSKIRKNLNLCPCYACSYYKRSLRYLKEHLLPEGYDNWEPGKMSDSLIFLDAIVRHKLSSLRFNELIQTALCLESMGNVMLSCCKVSKADKVKDCNLIMNLFIHSEMDSSAGMQNGFWDYIQTFSSDELTNFGRTVLYYWTTMFYYTKAGNHRESMQTLTKIFNVMSSYHKIISKESTQSIPLFSAEEFDSMCCSMEKVIRIQIARISQVRMCDINTNSATLKNILDDDGISLDKTSMMPEVEELLVSYYEFKLSQSSDKLLIGALYNTSSLRYLRNESTVYNRVISLMLKAYLNEKTFEMLDLSFKMNSNPECAYDNVSDDKVTTVSELIGVKNGDRNQFLSFLIVDSMFCLLSIAGIIQSSVKTTLFSNSFCYEVYEKLYYWVKWQNRIPQGSEFMNVYNSLKKKILEGHQIILLSPEYMYGMLCRYKDAAYSMHTEGAEYQSFIRGMFVLDDDLQNNTCQFNFALDRMKINSGFLDCMMNYDDEYYKSFAPAHFYCTTAQNRVND